MENRERIFENIISEDLKNGVCKADVEAVSVIVDGKQINAKENILISELIGTEKPCGGHGKCGKCKVVAKGLISQPSETELKLLSSEEISNGIRLSCLTYILGNCEITTLANKEKTQILIYGNLPEIEIKPLFANYGVAVDIGTTTIVARLYDRKGNLLSDTSMLNPQHEWGADVISRIEAALSGKEKTLASSIKQAINEIVSCLAGIAKISIEDIDYIVITGNTVMLSLFTEESVEPFSHSPFEVKRLFGEELTADELGFANFSPDTLIYLAPCISAFVGADTTCAILSTRLFDKNMAMLVDIGTNGEMVLCHNKKLVVCSTAAGPAFEGVGISMGMRGIRGAIDNVRILDGRLQAHIIGESKPQGICGSGLVDAVACMLELDMIDESGYLENEMLVIEEPVMLNQKDIRMLQLAKGAIHAGIMTMLKSENIIPSNVSALYIAGGFGNYLNIGSAVRIGLLPAEFTDKSKAVGNAALAGASMILLNSDEKNKAKDIVKGVKVLDLSTSDIFSNYYMSSMILGD